MQRSNYGRGAGVGCGLGVGAHLPVHGVGVGVGVGDAVGVGEGVGEGAPIVPLSPPVNFLNGSLIRYALRKRKRCLRYLGRRLGMEKS
jgi:hypothetical protein